MSTYQVFISKTLHFIILFWEIRWLKYTYKYRRAIICISMYYIHICRWLLKFFCILLCTQKLIFSKYYADLNLNLFCINLHIYYILSSGIFTQIWSFYLILAPIVVIFFLLYASCLIPTKQFLKSEIPYWYEKSSQSETESVLSRSICFGILNFHTGLKNPVNLHLYLFFPDTYVFESEISIPIWKFQLNWNWIWFIQIDMFLNLKFSY